MIPARGPPADHQIRPFCEIRAEEIIHPSRGWLVGFKTFYTLITGGGGGVGGGEGPVDPVENRSSKKRFIDDLGWWPEKYRR